jgi:hypothetical protein
VERKRSTGFTWDVPAETSPTAQTGGFSMNDIKTIKLVLTGRPGSLLVTHEFSEKAKKGIRDKQAKKAKTAKETRNPSAEYLKARYMDTKGRECAPITAVKKSFVTAATAMDNLTKVALRQAIFIAPTDAPSAMLVPILTLAGKPAVGEMREDAVTIGMGKRGLTYRPFYAEWQLRVTVEYNSRLISEEQLLSLAEQAGWGVGICEGRPEKTSALGWGRFSVAKA